MALGNESEDGDAKSPVNKQHLKSTIQNFFEQELAFVFFCAQVVGLVSLAWLIGYSGLSVAWVLMVAYVVSTYWHRVVDLFVREQVDIKWCEKLGQIKNPLYESVEWANVIVDRWLRFSEQELGQMLRSTLNPLLKSCKPPFLETLEMGTFSLGSGTPRISSLSISDLSTNPSESLVVEKVKQALSSKELFELVIEVDFEHTSPDFLIQVVGKIKTIAPEQIVKTYGFNLNVNIEKLKFSGRCQLGITFDRKIPFPHAKHAWIMFLDENPCISMSITTMHANVMALPKLNDWINTIIKTSLSDYVYYPHRFFIPLYVDQIQNAAGAPSAGLSAATESHAVEVTATGATRAQGLLIVTVMYGDVEDASSASSKSDDMIWCSIKLDSTVCLTEPKPANVPWAEKVAFLVYRIESDKLLVHVKSKSMLGKLTLAEYSVNIGKIGLQSGITQTIKPHKSKAQKTLNKDIPDLVFQLTYHQLASFAMADQLRKFSALTQDLITAEIEQDAAAGGLPAVAEDEVSESMAHEEPASPIVPRGAVDAEQEPISCTSGVVSVVVHSGHDLPAMDLNGYSDPYVNIYFANTKVKQSPPIKRTLNPVWNFHCDFMVDDFTMSPLLIEVFDWDGMTTKDDYIGCAELNVGETKNRDKIDLRGEGGAIGQVGFIIVSLKFHPFPELESILEKQDSERKWSRSTSFPLSTSISKPKFQSLDFSLEKQLGIIDEDVHDDIELEIVRAEGLKAADAGGTSDPFCVVTVDGNQHKFKTSVIQKTLDPVWNEKLIIPYPYKLIEFKLMDKDKLRDDFLGRSFLLTKEANGLNNIESVMSRCIGDSEYEHPMQLRDRDGQGTLFIRFLPASTKPMRADSEEDFLSKKVISGSVPSLYKRRQSKIGSLLRQVTNH